MLFLSIEADIPQMLGLAGRLDRLSATGLNKAIEDAVRSTTSPLPGRISRHARAILPRRGGLGGVVAQTPMPIAVRVEGQRVSALIRALPGAVKDPEAINRGRVRKPVFGHWPKDPLIQHVRAGWFTDPLLEGRPAIRTALETAARAEIQKALGG